MVWRSGRYCDTIGGRNPVLSITSRVSIGWVRWGGYSGMIWMKCMISSRYIRGLWSQFPLTEVFTFLIQESDLRCDLLGVFRLDRKISELIHRTYPRLFYPKSIFHLHQCIFDFVVWSYFSTLEWRRSDGKFLLGQPFQLPNQLRG